MNLINKTGGPNGTAVFCIPSSRKEFKKIYNIIARFSTLFLYFQSILKKPVNMWIASNFKFFVFSSATVLY